MSNPTSNFGWQMPTATDLVTDLPADFEVFGQAVDSSLADLKGGTTGQILSKASGADMDFVWAADAGGMPNPMTTTGDTIYSSSGSTPARLGIGTTGQVLAVSGGLPAWTTPSAAGANWSLLSTTALTSVSTVTITGISAKEQVLFGFANVSATSQAAFTANFNSDTGANYSAFGGYWVTYSTNFFNSFGATGGTGGTGIGLFDMSTSAASNGSGYILINGANTTGGKQYFASGYSNSTVVNQAGYQAMGIYSGTSAISSITFKTNSINFDTGTLYVYTSAA
jgi:hypothetical protein